MCLTKIKSVSYNKRAGLREETVIVSHLKKYREAANLSVKRLAEFARVSPQTIRHLENPKLKVNPTMTVGYLLAQYLGVPLVKLFEFVSDDYEPLPAPRYPPEVVELAEYLLETYGDYGDPTTDDLALYPECDAKTELTYLLQQLGVI